MQPPEGFPWNPARMLAPGTPRPGINGAIAGWEFLQQVITQILPQAWSELVALLGL